MKHSTADYENLALQTNSRSTVEFNKRNFALADLYMKEAQVYATLALAAATESARRELS